MKNDIKKIIDNLSNNIITIDLKEEYKNLILKNNNINNIYELGDIDTDSNKSFSLFNRRLSIKDFKKYFKKKKINYAIGDLENIIKYQKTLIRDMISINKNKIYLYGNATTEQIKSLEIKIKRYTNNYNINKKGKDYLITIETNNIKSGIIKNKIYYLKDTFTDLSNFISDLLSS